MTTTGMKTIVYPVSDLATAKATFAVLLGEPHTDSPYYVGFNAEGQEVGLNPQGHQQGMTGPIGYWHVPDVEAALGALESAGAKRQGDPRDVGGGTLLAVAVDADGNPIGLIGKP
jgi:predicted enzyme related to lactoylglutathione lyase